MELQNNNLNEQVNTTIRVMTKKSLGCDSEVYRYSYKTDLILNSSIENIELEFQKNDDNEDSYVFSCECTPDGPVTLPKAICIKGRVDFLGVSTIKKARILYTYKDVTIYDCTIGMITKLDGCIITSEYMIVDLPNKWLAGKFNSIGSLQYLPKFTIIFPRNENLGPQCYINNVFLNYELSFYEQNDVNDLRYKPHEVLFQQLENINTESIENTNTTTTLTFAINSELIHRGYFITNEGYGFNLNRIQQIKMTLNGHIRFDYSKWMINSNTIYVGCDAIYLPLNDNLDYKQISKKSLSGGTCNMSKILTAKIVIVCDKFPNIEKILIHALCLNEMMYDGKGNITIKHKTNTINNVVAPKLQNKLLKNIDVDDINITNESTNESDEFQNDTNNIFTLPSKLFI